jgi:hypothetical protein
MPIRPNVLSDVWDRVKIGEPDECWEWQAAVNRQGYGRFRFGGSHIGSHVAAFRDHNQQQTGGLMVLHSCDNPRCCNPAHLSLGDHEENMRQRDERGRNNVAKGEVHYKTKLTAEQAREILKAKGTATQKEIGNRYGVSHHVVSQIHRGVRWSCVAS